MDLVDSCKMGNNRNTLKVFLLRLGNRITSVSITSTLRKVVWNLRPFGYIIGTLLNWLITFFNQGRALNIRRILNIFSWAALMFRILFFTSEHINLFKVWIFLLDRSNSLGKDIVRNRVQNLNRSMIVFNALRVLGYPHMSQSFFRSDSMFWVDLEQLLHQVNSLVRDFQVNLMKIVAHGSFGILVDYLIDIISKERCAPGKKLV